MTIALDLIAFVFCVGSTIFAFKLAYLVKSRYLLPIVMALVYASFLRLVCLSIDLGFSIGITKANVQVMFSVFYILNCVGFAGIYLGFKNFLILVAPWFGIKEV